MEKTLRHLSKRIIYTLIFVAFVFIIEIGFYNIRWLDYKILNSSYTPFTISIYRLVLYIAVTLFILFYDYIKNLIFKLDKKFEGSCYYKENYNINESKFEKIFVLIALSFGLVFIFLVPPLNSPDEPAHFISAELLSQGQYFSPTYHDGQSYYLIDKDVNDLVTMYPGIAHHPDSKISYKQYSNTVGANVSKQKVNYEFEMLNYTPIGYFAQAIGIDTGRVLFNILGNSNDYNAFNQLIFARIFNLLYFILITYLAIRITPVFKRTFTIIALMPTTVFIAASCNYDVFVYSSCFLFTAMVLKYAFDKNVTHIGVKDIVKLSIMGCMVLMAKGAYIFLILILFLIPKEKFKGSRKKYLSIVIAAACSTIPMIVWDAIFRLGFSSHTIDSNASFKGLQMGFVLHNPMLFCLFIINSLKRSVFYSNTFVSGLGWNDVPTPFALIALFLAFILLSALLEKCSFKLTGKARCLIAVSFMLCALAVISALYLFYSGNCKTPGRLTVNGVQGRYFIPIAVVGLLLFANEMSSRLKFMEKINDSLSKITPIIIGATLTITLFNLFSRFYIA